MKNVFEVIRQSRLKKIGSEQLTEFLPKFSMQVNKYQRWKKCCSQLYFSIIFSYLLFGVCLRFVGVFIHSCETFVLLFSFFC
jgi:uncharacterized membrane protein YjjP (DUF1212 family)